MAKPTPTPVGITTLSNAGASNKSAPASVPSVPASVKKWLLLAFITLVVVICIVLIASVKRDRAKVAQAIPQYQQQTTIPLATSPQSSWPKLVIPANGKSQDIVVPAGMHITLIGDGFVLHSIYVDGHECTSKEICPNGYITGTFITNEAPTANTIAYAFTPN